MYEYASMQYHETGATTKKKNNGKIKLNQDLISNRKIHTYIRVYIDVYNAASWPQAPVASLTTTTTHWHTFLYGLCNAFLSIFAYIYHFAFWQLLTFKIWLLRKLNSSSAVAEKSCLAIASILINFFVTLFLCAMKYCCVVFCGCCCYPCGVFIQSFELKAFVVV